MSKKDLSPWSEELRKKLLCPNCCYLNDSPMQTMCCGTRICETCFKTEISQQPKCPKCGEPHPKARLDRGHERELKILIVTCPRCPEPWTGTFPELTVHLKTHKDLKCQWCEAFFILSEQLDHHQQMKCPSRLVPCPLASIGCSDEIRYNELEQHCLSLEHQLHLAEFLFKAANHLLLSEGQKLQIDAYHSQLKEIYEQVMNALGQLTPIEQQRDELLAQRATIEAKLADLIETFASAKELFAKSIQKCESIVSSYDEMGVSIKKLKSQSTEVPRSLEPGQTFTCKINLLTLLNLEGEIRSEPFQTSLNGYLMALGVEISTDTKTDERYIAVNVYFLPGEFDPILYWPFPFEMTVSLLRCQGKSQDLVYSIPRPTIESVYGRVEKRNTKPHRIAPFCSMDIVRKQPNDYVENDSIFIRAQVNF